MKAVLALVGLAALAYVALRVIALFEPKPDNPDDFYTGIG